MTTPTDHKKLRAQHEKWARPNSHASPGQRADSIAIIELLDEVERLSKANDDNEIAWQQIVREKEELQAQLKQVRSETIQKCAEIAREATSDCREYFIGDGIAKAIRALEQGDTK